MHFTNKFLIWWFIFFSSYFVTTFTYFLYVTNIMLSFQKSIMSPYSKFNIVNFLIIHFFIDINGNHHNFFGWNLRITTSVIAQIVPLFMLPPFKYKLAYYVHYMFSKLKIKLFIMDVEYIKFLTWWLIWS